MHKHSHTIVSSLRNYRLCSGKPGHFLSNETTTRRVRCVLGGVGAFCTVPISKRTVTSGAAHTRPNEMGRKNSKPFNVWFAGHAARIAQGSSALKTHDRCEMCEPLWRRSLNKNALCLRAVSRFARHAPHIPKRDVLSKGQASTRLINGVG